MNPDHLLDQADALCRPVVGRPRQADLRRAVSAAYYALFHRLVDAACEQIAGAAADRADARAVLARGFVHGEMRDASRSFGGGNLPSFLAGRYGGAAVPRDVARVAAAFGRLQADRHAADYDRARAFTQTAALGIVREARDAVRLAAELKNSDLGRLYLLALLTWSKLRR